VRAALAGADVLLGLNEPVVIHRTGLKK